MDNILIIYNFAQLYRKAIFQQIENCWSCNWIFGHNKTDIKELDTNLLKNVIFIDNKKIIGSFYWQAGAYKNALNYGTILALGEPFNLSTWAILLKNKISRNKKKIYLWSHGWYGREGIIKKWMKQLFFGLADATFLYGNYAKKIAIQQGFKKSKLYVIHNSLDYENQIKIRNKLSYSTIYREHFKNNYPTLIFIGRLTQIKRLDLLVEAVNILKNRGEYYNVVLIGDGEDKKNIEEVIKKRDIKSQIWFYGGCYDDTKNAQLIYDADLCVAPGNVGLTAMHTMVFGCPVLTHDDFTLQMPEFEAINPGRTGAFFRYGDVKSLADAISTWFKSHGDEREQIREWCYQEIDNNWTPKYQIKVLKSVLNSNESI